MLSMHLVCLSFISKYILESMISATLASLQMIKHNPRYRTCDTHIASKDMMQTGHF